MRVYLETPRLILREFTEDDAAELFALDGDPEVMRYVGPYRLADVDAYREHIRNEFLSYYSPESEYGFRAAVEKAGGAFLGWFVLRPAFHYRFAREAGFRARQLELGYRLRRSAWGKGYATEGARALVHKAFTELEAPCVVAVALVENRASTRVLEKAGLLRAGEFRQPGFDTPAVKYALSREEYNRRAAEGAAEGMLEALNEPQPFDPENRPGDDIVKEMDL
jgi:RimJ/RimL family protein N-acetyltransferase